MKKRIIALMMAGALALGMGCMAFADETEGENAVYEDYLVMNGFDGENAWTILLNSADATGTVSIASSEDDVQALYGSFEGDGESFTIHNEEDDTDYTFMYEEKDNANITFSNADGSTSFDGVFVNSSIAEVINDYYWYAGKDGDGDSLVLGISDDLDYVIFGYVFADGSDDAFLGCDYDAESGIATDADGNEYPLTLEFTDDSGLFVDATFDDATTPLYFVNPGCFPEFESED